MFYFPKAFSAHFEFYLFSNTCNYANDYIGLKGQMKTSLHVAQHMMDPPWEEVEFRAQPHEECEPCMAMDPTITTTSFLLAALGCMELGGQPS